MGMGGGGNSEKPIGEKRQVNWGRLHESFRGRIGTWTRGDGFRIKKSSERREAQGSGPIAKAMLGEGRKNLKKNGSYLTREPWGKYQGGSAPTWGHGFPRPKNWGPKKGTSASSCQSSPFGGREKCVATKKEGKDTGGGGQH